MATTENSAWKRDPGGEVSAQDTPEAMRRTRTQAWLDAHAYWYPQRIKATYGAISEADLEGKHYRVLEAHPEGGDPVTLWFDPANGLLARVVQRQGADTATTVLDDYRDAGGVRIPFHSTAI